MLRELSEQAVLETIFRHGPISRPQISERTGLSKPTVSDTVARLVATGLVVEAGHSSGRPGRIATLFSVDSHAGYVVGVDLGGTMVRAAVANIYGETLAERRIRTDARGGTWVLSQVIRLARRTVEESATDWSQVVAFALATPGVLDARTGRVRLAYNIAGWDHIDLLDRLQRGLGVRVLIDNDVNLAAVAEKWRGIAHDVPTFAFMAVGTGVGMGLVLNDELFRGAHGAAGEVAYLPLAADPWDRRHMVRGALEDEASGAGIVEAAAGRQDWDVPPPQTAEEVFALAAAGHRVALELVEAEGRRLGLAIAAVCAVVDPALVVLGGAIGSNPLLLEPVRRAARPLLPLPPRIERSLLGEKAALYGALEVALRAARDDLFTRRRG